MRCYTRKLNSQRLVDGTRCPNSKLAKSEFCANGCTSSPLPCQRGRADDEVHEENDTFKYMKPNALIVEQYEIDQKLAKLEHRLTFAAWDQKFYPEEYATTRARRDSEASIEQVKQEISHLKSISPRHRTISLPDVGEASSVQWHARQGPNSA